MTDLRCGICRRPMIPSGEAEQDDDPRIDCAGDCLGCIRRIESRPHTRTVRYWKAMYEDQVRRKRSLHERYDDLHKRHTSAGSERDFWRNRYETQHRTLHHAEDVIAELRASLREVYDYMAEVEGAHAGCCAVRSYLSLPRTADERMALGERARRLLEAAR